MNVIRYVIKNRKNKSYVKILNKITAEGNKAIYDEDVDINELPEGNLSIFKTMEDAYSYISKIRENIPTIDYEVVEVLISITLQEV